MIQRPIIILGAPRSGTTILHRCLSLHPELWHLPGESHSIFEGPFHPATRGYSSNRLTSTELEEELTESLRKKFYHSAINLNLIFTDPGFLMTGNKLSKRILNRVLIILFGSISRIFKANQIRLLEKTPKNSLRVPLLDRIFPDALFILNVRAAQENIDSLITGWNATEKIGLLERKRFARAGYPIADKLNLLDYHDKWWKFALVPGWQSLEGKSLADVAAWQYYQCYSILMEDLKSIDQQRIFSILHEEFVKQPVDLLREILNWAGLPISDIVDNFALSLPRVNYVGPLQTNNNQLRFPKQIGEAIERLPELKRLQQNMGY